jgi:hypothetical protein
MQIPPALDQNQSSCCRVVRCHNIKVIFPPIIYKPATSVEKRVLSSKKILFSLLSTSSVKTFFSPINIYMVTVEIIAETHADLYEIFLILSDLNKNLNVSKKLCKITSKKFHKNYFSDFPVTGESGVYLTSA